MILVIGGTSDSVQIANKLYMYNEDVVLSTATAYGESIAKEGFRGTVIAGRKDYIELLKYCIDEQIATIVDVSHPYAHVVSENAIKVSKELNIDYFRYERPESDRLKYEETDNEEVLFFQSYEEIADYLNSKSGNVLLTTGSKDVPVIAEYMHDLSRLYVRFLPISSTVRQLENIGFKAKQMIAMQGPFSYEINIEMIKKVNASFLVTKDSGSVGKTDEKINAARHCGIQVLVALRPEIDYPNKYEIQEELIKAIVSPK